MLGISCISDVQAIDAFVAACLTWCLNHHLLSSNTSRHFISCLTGITFPFISNRGALYFLRLVTKIASHLHTVSSKNLLVSDSAISSGASLEIISTNHAFLPPLVGPSCQQTKPVIPRSVVSSSIAGIHAGPQVGALSRSLRYSRR